MRRVQLPAEVVFEHFSLDGKIVVDVGCGTGDLARQMAGRGASVLGIDTATMLEKAAKYPQCRREVPGRMRGSASACQSLRRRSFVYRKLSPHP